MCWVDRPGSALHKEISFSREQVPCPGATVATVLSLLSIYEFCKSCSSSAFGSLTRFSRLEANGPVTRRWFGPTKACQSGWGLLLTVNKTLNKLKNFVIFSVPLSEISGRKENRWRLSSITARLKESWGSSDSGMTSWQHQRRGHVWSFTPTDLFACKLWLGSECK